MTTFSATNDKYLIKMTIFFRFSGGNAMIFISIEFLTHLTSWKPQTNQSATRQDKARQDKTRQDNRRQHPDKKMSLVLKKYCTQEHWSCFNRLSETMNPAILFKLEISDIITRDMEREQCPYFVPMHTSTHPGVLCTSTGLNPFVTM